MKTFATLLLTGLLLASCSTDKKEVKPTYRDVTETVFASGALEPDGKYNLTAQSEGYLVSLSFKEGDVVKTGQLLCVVDNKQNVVNEKSAEQLLQISKFNTTDNAPAILQTEANLKLAAEKLKQEETQAERYRKLWASKSVSQLEFENAQLAVENAKTNITSLKETLKLQKQQAQQQLIAQQAQKNVNQFFSGNNQVRALVGGKIYKKMKDLGDYVRKGDVLAQIGNPDNIYARINVDESNISKVKLGQKAQIQLNSNKDKVYDGEVFEILPAFEESSQSFIAKVKFLQEPEMKISGTQLQTNLVVGTKKKAFVIPRAYLDYGNKVYLKGKDDPVVVKTGFVSTDWVEVLQGLKAEDVLEIRVK